MKKVKITADTVLAILQGIFNDSDIDHVMGDTAPPSWQGKKVSEVLNVEYYTFKHRAQSTQEIIQEITASGESANKLSSLNRAFCLCSLGETERLYSKDVDMAVLSARLDYYIQSAKVKLLENLIEDSNIAASGQRINVSIDGESRKAVLFFGRPIASDLQTASAFGETVKVSVEVTVMLYPDVVSYSEYTVSFKFDNSSNSVTLPLSSFSVANTMTQKAMPCVDNVRNVGNINLSRAVSFVLVFDGYNNEFVNYIADNALSSNNIDNNAQLEMTVTRNGKSYTHNVIIKDHQIMVNADTGNETHTLSLVAAVN